MFAARPMIIRARHVSARVYPPKISSTHILENMMLQVDFILLCLKLNIIKNDRYFSSKIR